MIGTWFWRPRSRSSTHRPLCTGKVISSSTRSGRLSSTRATALSPSPIVSVRYPRSLRLRASPSAIAASSSTIATSAPALVSSVMWPLGSGVARCRIARRDRPAFELVEDRRLLQPGDPDDVVADRDRDHLAVGAGAHLDLLVGRSGVLPGVAEQVAQRLRQR